MCLCNISGETHSDTMCDPASPVTVSCSAITRSWKMSDLATGTWSGSGSAGWNRRLWSATPHCQTQCFYFATLQLQMVRLISLKKKHSYCPLSRFPGTCCNNQMSGGSRMHKN